MAEADGLREDRRDGVNRSDGPVRRHGFRHSRVSVDHVEEQRLPHDLGRLVANGQVQQVLLPDTVDRPRDEFERRLSRCRFADSSTTSQKTYSIASSERSRSKKESQVRGNLPRTSEAAEAEMRATPFASLKARPPRSDDSDHPYASKTVCSAARQSHQRRVAQIGSDKAWQGCVPGAPRSLSRPLRCEDGMARSRFAILACRRAAHIGRDRPGIQLAQLPRAVEQRHGYATLTNCETRFSFLPAPAHSS